MNIKRYDRAYFIGIGGIGMSALARYFLKLGWDVAGYDKTESPLTGQLMKEGISIHFDDAQKEIPSFFKNIERTLVIYTPAIPADSAELNYFMDNQFDVLKRARVVAEIANSGFCIAVAGTHGKTTTSTLIAHILKHNKKNVTAFLGGISSNYETNLIAGKAKEVVIEADEYDRSFLNLRPDIALLTSMDADHLDIYETEGEIVKNFRAFMALVKPGGQRIVRSGLDAEGLTYSIDGDADYKGTDIRVQDGEYRFRIKHGRKATPAIRSGLPGRHNVENAVAAAAVCHQAGLNWEQIASGIETFLGVRRRFEYQVRKKDRVYIDDYAHHPKEITALIRSVRELYPNQRITAIFQPHLFSRTRDFGSDFAKALSLADRLWLMEIYPAREKPIPNINSQWLLDKVELQDKDLLTTKGILKKTAADPSGITLTIGAGDIDRIVQPLKQLLEDGTEQ